MPALFRPPPKALQAGTPKNWLVLGLATWFGSGLAAKAPGTMGSLAALPFGWWIGSTFGPWGLMIAGALLFPVGTWAAQVYVTESGEEDPGPVVVDEVVGQWMVMAVAPLTPLGVFMAFGLFRFFDILKPWPVSLADRRVKGGFGVMLDDVLAGLYGMVVAWAVLWGLKDWF
ncbi:MAG: phosphatidylglycerophosphatase A [Magnetovibrionaceae bacterium]